MSGNSVTPDTNVQSGLQQQFSFYFFCFILYRVDKCPSQPLLTSWVVIGQNRCKYVDRLLAGKYKEFVCYETRRRLYSIFYLSSPVCSNKKIDFPKFSALLLMLVSSFNLGVLMSELTWYKTQEFILNLLRFFNMLLLMRIPCILKVWAYQCLYATSLVFV